MMPYPAPPNSSPLVAAWVEAGAGEVLAPALALALAVVPADADAGEDRCNKLPASVLIAVGVAEWTREERTESLMAAIG